MAEPAETPLEIESELLRRAQAGDEVAFGELMRSRYELVFRLVQSIIREEHSSRDVCQEIWISIWRNLPNFRHEAKFSTWLHSIAVRKSIDHLRSRQRWRQRLLPILSSAESEAAESVPHATEPAEENNPRQEAERHERNERFERAIAALPPKHRAVLALREINGLSYDEIATTLEIRRGTVMSRLFNARRMLAQKLGELPCD